MSTPRRPGLRLHDRTMHVQSRSAALHLQLLEFQDKQDVTDAEMLIMLADYQRQIGTRCLRAERHPDDPSRKADEA